MDAHRPAAATPALGPLAHAPAPDAGAPAARAAAAPPRGAARALLARAWRVALRRPADAFAAAAFFLLLCGVCALVTAPWDLPRPLTAAWAVWLAALVSALLGPLQALREDARCGVLDQIRLAPAGPLAPVAALLAAQAAATGAPLLLATPAAALFFGLPAHGLAHLALALLAGLPALCVLATFAGALMLASRAGPALLGVLVLPLALPVLLFGVRAAADGPGGALLLLAAFSLASAAAGPFLLAAALRLEEQA